MDTAIRMIWDPLDLRRCGPRSLEEIIFLLLGIAMISTAEIDYHEKMNTVGQVITLVIYLGVLVGVTAIEMPKFTSPFWMIILCGTASGFLDSFVVLVLLLRMWRCLEGPLLTKMVFMVLATHAALIGGNGIWFGELYAVPIYLSDERTGFLSALYAWPPIALYLCILGIIAKLLPLKIVLESNGRAWSRFKKYAIPNFWQLVGFTAGIVFLLKTHNPLMCLGWALTLATIIGRAKHVLDVIRQEIEINVILVLLIALVAGSVIGEWASMYSLDQGWFAPIVPAALQAVLWGPIYNDPTVSFWVHILTISTGALILPTSSLVGVVIFKDARGWLIYILMSIPSAALWYAIFVGWILFTQGTPVEAFLEQWAHVGPPVHH